MTFESILSAVSEKAKVADALGSTLKFSFGDDQYIYLDGTTEDNVVSSENKDADCTVEVSMEDLSAMMNGELSPMTAFMEQKLKVDGDMGVAMKLQSIIA